MTVKTWEFSYSEDQRQKFRTGELWREWAGQYPDIFDKDDPVKRDAARKMDDFFGNVGVP